MPDALTFTVFCLICGAAGVVLATAGGGHFPAREIALIPAMALPKVAPGSVVDAYYRPGDESTIAVFVCAG